MPKIEQGPALQTGTIFPAGVKRYPIDRSPPYRPFGGGGIPSASNGDAHGASLRDRASPDLAWLRPVRAAAQGKVKGSAQCG